MSHFRFSFSREGQRQYRFRKKLSLRYAIGNAVRKGSSFTRARTG